MLTAGARSEVRVRSRAPDHRWQKPLTAWVSDAALVGAAVFAAVALTSWLSPDRALVAQLRGQVVDVPIFLFALAIHGRDRHRRRDLPPCMSTEAPSLVHALMTAIVLTLLVDAAGIGSTVDATTVVTLCLVGAAAFVLLPLGRAAVLRLGGGTNRSVRILIVGAGSVAERVASRLSREAGITVVGNVDDDPPVGEQVLGGLAELPELCARHAVDRLVVAFSRTPTHETLESLRDLASHIPVSVVPRFYELITWRSHLEELHGMPLIHIAPAQASAVARGAKRATDIVGGLVVMVVTAPIALVTALAIKLTSPGPVLFGQTRLGRDARPFTIYKFRTMHVDAHAQRERLALQSDVDGPIFKLKSDPRVTRVGVFLRRTSIDELPQILNVLRGQMSLVGPRPFLTDEATELNRYAARRTDVLPGMTGMWQVCGRTDLSYEDLKHLDTSYVTGWSFASDLRIIMKTVPALMKKTGAY